MATIKEIYKPGTHWVLQAGDGYVVCQFNVFRRATEDMPLVVHFVDGSGRIYFHLPDGKQAWTTNNVRLVSAEEAQNGADNQESKGATTQGQEPHSA